MTPTDAPGGLLAAWLLTYAIHSTILLGTAWLVVRFARTTLALRDVLWKTALLGALVTASWQLAIPGAGPCGEPLVSVPARCRRRGGPLLSSGSRRLRGEHRRGRQRARGRLRGGGPRRRYGGSGRRCRGARHGPRRVAGGFTVSPPGLGMALDPGRRPLPLPARSRQGPPPSPAPRPPAADRRAPSRAPGSTSPKRRHPPSGSPHRFRAHPGAGGARAIRDLPPRAGADRPRSGPSGKRARPRAGAPGPARSGMAGGHGHYGSDLLLPALEPAGPPFPPRDGGVPLRRLGGDPHRSESHPRPVPGRGGGLDPRPGAPGPGFSHGRGGLAPGAADRTTPGGRPRPGGSPSGLDLGRGGSHGGPDRGDRPRGDRGPPGPGDRLSRGLVLSGRRHRVSARGERVGGAERPPRHLFPRPAPRGKRGPARRIRAPGGVPAACSGADPHRGSDARRTGVRFQPRTNRNPPCPSRHPTRSRHKRGSYNSATTCRSTSIPCSPRWRIHRKPEPGWTPFRTSFAESSDPTWRTSTVSVASILARSSSN